MNLSALLERVLTGQNLSRTEARGLMAQWMEGAMEPTLVAAFLAGLRAKGVSAQELAGFAEEMRNKALRIEHSVPGVVDTCGTGGGIASFNLSTAAAFVAAGAGTKIAKHGNRKVTSSCGSADVLEALGAKLDAPAGPILASIGICFLFAPAHHPAMRHVGPIRQQLGVRTVFNQLGPLSNPAGASRQVIGVYDPALIGPMAEALAILGAERAAIVHGFDGLDEVSPTGDTRIAWLDQGVIRDEVIDSTSFGLQPVHSDALLPGGTVKENADILKVAISDPESNRCLAILPNSAVAIYVSGLAANLNEAASLARQSVASGAALAKLTSFINATQQ